MAIGQGVHQIISPAGDDALRGYATYPVASAGFLALSLVVPFFELKPNRIASGFPVWAWSSPWSMAAIILLLLTEIYALFNLKRKLAIAGSFRPWITAAMQVFSWLVFFTAMTGSAALVEKAGTAGMSMQRLSPSSGFWLALMGSFLAGRWSRIQFQRSVWLRAAMALGFTAAMVLAWRLGALERFSPWLELRAQGSRFMAELARHVVLTLGSFAFALVVGVLGAVMLSRGTRTGRLLGMAAGALQNIPSLALFGLLLPAMAALADALPFLRNAGVSGIGFAPAFIALAIYALLPVMLAGAAGLSMVDAGARDAAKGMGMNRLQVLLRVELPLALPAIAGGARTALVQTVGTTTVAALIGAGGLGYFVFQGVGQAAMDMVIIGVVPIVALSVLADRLMASLERHLSANGGALWR